MSQLSNTVLDLANSGQKNFSDTFNKQNGYCYDDDYVSEHGKLQIYNINDNSWGGDDPAEEDKEDDHRDYHGDNT